MKKRLSFPNLFLFFACVAITLIALSLLHEAGLKPSDGATIFAGLLAFAIVWWQGDLIKHQMQLSAMIELDREWNSREMLENRKAAWNDQNMPNKETIEGALEFLEKVSTFEERGIISPVLIWETFGWYVSRYYHYSKDVIAQLRKEWTPGHEDLTLYEDLEALYDKLIKVEVNRRNKKRGDRPKLKEKDVKDDLNNTKDKFVSSEKGEPMIKAPPKVLLELAPSRINGVGVFAVPNIKRGQKVADGISEQDYEDLVPWTRSESYDAEVRKKIEDFCIGTPEGFIPPEELDFNKLSVEWYLNHSCAGNCGFDENGDFVAIRDIQRREELTYDYALAESNPNFTMKCACGSKNCRKNITGNDWKDEAFQANNREHMLPHLRRLVRIHS